MCKPTLTSMDIADTSKAKDGIEDLEAKESAHNSTEPNTLSENTIEVGENTLNASEYDARVEASIAYWKHFLS